MTQRDFAHFVAIDWSGAVGERQKGIAVAVAAADAGPPTLIERSKPWARAEILGWIHDGLPDNSLVGLDLGISLPFVDCGAYFPGNDRSPSDAKALWRLVDDVCGTDDHFAASSFTDHSSFAPYFRRHGGREGPMFRCDEASHGRGRFRVTEHAQAAMGCKPYSNFNLVGAAQVGKSSLTGMRLLNRLNRPASVWPIDEISEEGPVIVEIYTALAAMAAGRSASRSKIRSFEDLDQALQSLGSPPLGRKGPIDDHASDALLAAAWLRKVAKFDELWHPPALTPAIARTEGWTFGAI